jgi:2-dehydropantoate 2-reductase
VRYAVVGIGAVGSIIGFVLKNSKEDVVLITKPKQAKILKKKGLTVRGLKSSVKTFRDIDVSSNFSSLKNVDVIFVCVKSTDTENVAKKLKGNLRKETLIISLQNGVRNAKILKDTIENTTISGVVIFNAILNEIGDASITIQGKIFLEYNEDFENSLKKIKKIFDKNGVKIKVVEDIEGFLWSKLIINLQNAVTALTGQTIKESLLNPISRKIIFSTIKEGIEVTKKSGIKLKSSTGLNPSFLLFLLRFPNPFIKLGIRLFKIKSNAKSSMLQSICKGKATEIDFLNGEIVKLAEKQGLNANINKKLVQLVKEREKRKTVDFIPPYKLLSYININ